MQFNRTSNFNFLLQVARLFYLNLALVECIGFNPTTQQPGHNRSHILGSSIFGKLPTRRRAFNIRNLILHQLVHHVNRATDMSRRPNSIKIVRRTCGALMRLRCSAVFICASSFMEKVRLCRVPLIHVPNVDRAFTSEGVSEKIQFQVTGRLCIILLKFILRTGRCICPCLKYKARALGEPDHHRRQGPWAQP